MPPRGTLGTVRRLVSYDCCMSDWVAAHRILWTLAAGCAVLAIYLPVQASGFSPMWPVAAAATLLVGATGMMLVAAMLRDESGTASSP